jgi:hypothetical protein
MDDLEYGGKIKGMTTLKQMIAEKKVHYASDSARLRAEEEAAEKAYKEAVEFEQRNPRVRLNTGEREGRTHWTREPFNDE